MANEVRIRVVAEDKTSHVFKGVHTAMSALAKGALVLGGAVAAGLGVILVKGLKRLDAIDTAKAKLRGLGHSAGEVQKIMDNALKAVKGTAFGLDEAATVAASAVAAGIKPGQELQRTLKLVADAATIGGTSMADMGRIFNQVATSNRVYNDTLNELGDRGIPIIQLLAKTMHVSAAEVRDLAAQGKIDFKTFQTALEKGVGGAALDAGDTFTGAMKNVNAALSRLGGALLEGAFPKIKSGLKGLIGFLDDLQPAAKKVGDAFGDFIDKVSKDKDLKASLKRLGDAIKGITDKDFSETLDAVADALPGIVDGMADAADAVGEFYDAVVAVNGVLKDNGGMFDEKGPLGGITKWVKKTWHDAATSFTRDNGEIIDGAKNMVSRVIEWVGKLPGRAKNALKSLGSKIGSEVEQAKDSAVRKAKDLVNRAIDWISKLPGRAKSALSSLASKAGSEVEQAKDTVLRKARDMVNRFIDRMQELVRKAKDQAGRVKSAITDKFAGAGDWLYSKGKAVINGLLDGMKAPWQKLKDWVSGIAGWIKAHKGPVSLDRQLLHPAGRALMEGLLSGLKFGFKGVGDFVYKAGSKVSDIISKIKDSLFGGFGSLNFGKLASGGYRVLGRAMAAAYGWTGANWNALNALWTRESGWNPKARNPSSGAAGIPQDITGNFHGGAAGQITWGLKYIKGRYGSPLAAWAHSQRTGWYDRGGILPSGGVAMNASGLPERVLSPAMTQSFDRLVRVMDRGGGAANTYITINAPNYVGSQDDLRRTLIDMNRRGQLEVIKKR